MKEMTIQEAQEALKSFGVDVNIVEHKSRRKLSDVPVGETFKVGDLEFIVLEHKNNTTAVLLKGLLEMMKFCKYSNDYTYSDVWRELNDYFYDRLTAVIDANSIVFHEVDLTSDDGRDDYGTTNCNVSLLTCDMYRKYVRILDKYRPNSHWWWLATAQSTESNGCTVNVCVVLPDGTIHSDACTSYNGVRPYCVFKSDILVI